MTTHVASKSTIIHANLRISGKGEHFFRYLLSAIDSDFPTDLDKKCERCGGVMWRSPLLEVWELKRLAMQASTLAGEVTVKCDRWLAEERCV